MFRYEVPVSDVDFPAVHTRQLAGVIAQSETMDPAAGREVRRRAIKSMLQLTGVMAVNAAMPFEEIDAVLDALDPAAAYRRGTDSADREKEESERVFESLEHGNNVPDPADEKRGS
jgi:hypothetical protein